MSIDRLAGVVAAVALMGSLAGCATGPSGLGEAAGRSVDGVAATEDLTRPPPDRGPGFGRRPAGAVQSADYTGDPADWEAGFHTADLRDDGPWQGIGSGWRLAQADASPPSAPAGEGGGGGGVDLASANQAFANPLAQATLAIIENDTVTLGGDLSDGNRRTNVTVFEPLIPVPLGNSGWSLVNRPILPIGFGADVPVAGGGGGPTTGVGSPQFDGKNGLGDFTIFSLLTPTKGDSPIKWGIGPIFRFPTATDDQLGAEKFSLGPAAVALYSSKNFTIGALNQNLFSVAGDGDRDDVRVSTLQYFAFYNFTPEWGIGTAPIISVDWDEAGNADGYAVPVGLGVTRTFRIGEIPSRMLVEAQRYVVQKESFGPEWNFRVALAMFFPLLF
jgi:hypothetical protein